MYLIALLPIIVLFILSLTRGVKTAVWITGILTSCLFFYWGASWPHYIAALGTSALTSLNILMIVFGATFLYNIMSGAGLIDEMSHSLDGLGSSANVRFFLIAFGMTAFFEGVAGFGTPGAIVPLILIAMRYDPLRSVSTVLLFDGLFSAFGAVGTPLISGLQQPLALDYDTVKHISLLSAVLLSLVGLLAVFILFGRKEKTEMEEGRKTNFVSILWLYLLFVGPYILFAWLIPELATVLASLCMLGFSVIYLRRDGLAMNMKAWLPYTLLALLLLLPKIFGTLRHVLDVEIGFSNMFGTDIGGDFQPLLSPFVPFVLIGLAVAYFKKCKTWQLGSSLKKVGQVSVILYPSIVIAQLMLLSDVVQPSMVEHIATLKGKLGDVYPFFSPFVGVVGTFITGSTTLSNIVFGPSQLATAEMLLMDKVAILSLQHTGASIGNAICLFNIIAAAAIAGINNFSGILSGNLKPILWLGGLLGLLGMVLVHVL